MAEIDTIRERLKQLKSQGKTPSDSKEAGKLAKRFRELKDSGSVGSSSIGSTGDFASTLSNVANNIRTQFQPAIDVVQQGIPGLQDRFSKLVQDIKGERDIALDAQTLATRNELARRGILSGSGLAQQEQAKAVRPITQQTSTQLGQLGVQQEGLLQNIRERLAGLLTQPATLGVNTALNLLSQQQQADQFSRNLALSQAAQDLQRSQFEQATLPQTLANIGLTNAQAANVGNFDNSLLATLFPNGIPGQNSVPTSSLTPPQMSSTPGATFTDENGWTWQADGQGGWE